MTGEIYINGKDAYKTWGINFEDGALTALLTPAPMKEYIENASRLEHGKRILTTNARKDERDVTLPFHLIAASKSDFLTKYNAFCTDVLAAGAFTLTSKYQSGVTYHLVYLSCTQFSQFQQTMAKFSLKVCEPNPNNRS